MDGPKNPEEAQDQVGGAAVSGTQDEVDWIDRTNEPLHEIGNGYTLSPNLQLLCLTNNRLTKIERLENCTGLQELVLRQNAISVIEGLDNLENLVDLDLYMNKIEAIPKNAFARNSKLKRLDLSFNDIRSLAEFPSSNFPSLEELYLIGNKIKLIQGISLNSLRLLELGDNRIRAIENLENVSGLDSLWLGRNKIAKIQNLGALSNLKKLSLQSNRIEVIEGLDHLCSLEELYLSHNGIREMRGIANLTNLSVLDLAENRIEHIEEVERMVHLHEFWMNGNQLANIKELKQLEGATRLDTVYLEGNPLASEENYCERVLQILPASLSQLDASSVAELRRNCSPMSESKTQVVGEGETIGEKIVNESVPL